MSVGSYRNDGARAGRRGTRRPGCRCRTAVVFLVCLAVYLLFGYGGIRSPDSEIVYRTARSLAFEGSFAVDEGLESWPGFALVRGGDGRLYSLFQPLEPILLAPWVRVAEPLSRTDWAARVLPEPSGSHYVKRDVGVMLGLPPEDPQPHRARALVMPFGAVVAAAGAVMFFWIVRLLVGSHRAAVATTAIYAFGTLNLSYAGTLFKEPLVNLFILSSLYLLLRVHWAQKRPWGGCLLSGFLMSLAVATHLMTVPMLPFYALLAGLFARDGRRPWARALGGGAVWSLGAVPVLLALAWFNAVRFGGVMNTGYGLAVDQSWWQRFNPPWVGLSGLFFSPGKSILFYCPVVMVGMFQWRRLHRAAPVLSVVTAAMVLVRVLFAAAYNDWHGGFCIGPRFMLSLVPFLLLPVGLWVRAVEDAGGRAAWVTLFAVVWLSISQQIAFALGEVFSYLHHVKWEAARQGVNIFENGMIYFNWRLAPLLHLLEGNRGPYLLRNIPLSNFMLWAVLSVLTFLIVLRLVQWLREGEGNG